MQVFKRCAHWQAVGRGQRADSDPFVVAETIVDIKLDGGSEYDDLAKRAVASAVERMTGLDRLRRGPPPTVVHDVTPDVAGIVVLPEGRDKMLPAYVQLVGSRIPYVLAPDVAHARAVLLAEFPHAADAVAALMQGLRTGEPVALRPTLLLGEPGCGKSRLVRRFAEVLGLPLAKFDAAGSADSSFSGSPKQWSTSTPSHPFRAIARAGVCNPVVLIEELDKASGSAGWAGTLLDGLTAFLEPENAMRHPDPSLDVTVNLAGVCYLMTANDAKRVPEPIRDRIRIVRVGRPALVHLPALTATVLADLARADGDFVVPLDFDELDVVGRAWAGTDMSIRKLQAILRATITARENYAVRH